MKRSQIDEILSKVQKQATATAVVRSMLPTRKKEDVNQNGIPDDEEDYVPVGTKGLLAASEKLLAVNRGLDKPDERDALMFKRILTTDKLLSERVRLDSGRIRGAMLPLIARHKNLKALGPFVFDNYTEKFLIGNPLSSPLEEINPLHLLEQSRRATQMGPGGIGTDNAITEAMQEIRTDQFGFISTLEGPESEKIGIDTRLAWGSKIGSDGKLYQKFHDRRSGKNRWMSAEDLDGLTIKLPD
jgi:DNA-directed RNA polymerase beta subunit